MKIFAAETAGETVTPFDQFVGKNIWVFCKTTYGTQAYPVYVRFLSRHDYGLGHVVFDVSMLDWDRLDRYRNNSSLYGPRDEFSFVENKRISANYLRLPSKVKTLTTEELFQITESLGEDSHMLNRLASRHCWFKATIITGDTYNSEYYVKIHAKTGDIIELEYIDPMYVDDYSYETGEFEEPSSHMENCTLNVDSIKLVEPIEVLTDEEMDEMLHDNDVAFEDGYWADQEDDEEEDYDE